MVTFTSSKDLAEIARQSGYNLGVEAAYCDADNRLRPGQLDIYPYVYNRNGEVNFNGNAKPDLIGSLYRYEFFLYLKSAARIENSDPGILFDPKDRSASMCFRVRGGNMLGSVSKSNIVAIPGAVIANLVSK